MDDLQFRQSADQLRARGDLRDIVRSACKDYQYAWSAPVAIRCPRCRSANIVECERVMVAVPRV